MTGKAQQVPHISHSDNCSQDLEWEETVRKCSGLSNFTVPRKIKTWEGWRGVYYGLANDEQMYVKQRDLIKL
jgi:hypothetical protein